MDVMVQRAQIFVNDYRTAHNLTSQIPQQDTDGKTGWPIMRALTRVLQHLLGITALSDTFGPATQAALTSQYPVVTASAPMDVCKVLQSALYCKGYDGGGIDGILGPIVDGSVASARSNMGLSASGGVTPKVFKALLNMDAYVLLSGGDSEIRSVQQWLNGRYLNRRDFYVGPCDGWFSRDVQKALVLAIQFELGMSDDQAIGVFGPSTQAGVKDHVITVGTSGIWASLFAALLVCNRRSGSTFTSTFTSSLSTVTSTFQSFAALPVTGKGDYQTWASLIVSKGDETRIGTACDCSTPLTSTTAAALKNAGYRIVGRYLTNAAGGMDKKLRPAEITLALAQGLAIFPIYQTTGNYIDYFNTNQGKADAWAAINALQELGFKAGTRVYFAVDFDAYDYQVTDVILPHFRGIKSAFDRDNSGYKIGIYGARNVCTRVADEGISTGSFMLDMSTAYSGNMGVPHCADWTFDQISSRTVGGLSIDNDIASGRDSGQSSFNSPRSARLDIDCTNADWTTLRPLLLTQMRQYWAQLGHGDYWLALGLNFNSIPDCIDIIWSHDTLITNLARKYEMRKALIQAVLFRELYCVGLDDTAADGIAANCYVENSLNQSAPGDMCESSTGVAQCRPSTSIAARNYCSSFTGEATMSLTSLSVNGAEWDHLRLDAEYCISRVPLIHFYDAHLKYQIDRLALEPGDTITQGVIARYNGTGPAADNYGSEVMGAYRLYEQQNASLRAR